MALDGVVGDGGACAWPTGQGAVIAGPAAVGGVRSGNGEVLVGRELPRSEDLSLPPDPGRLSAAASAWVSPVVGGQGASGHPAPHESANP